MADPKTKICNRCLKRKKLTMFDDVNGTAAPRKKAWCRPCGTILAKEWAAKPRKKATRKKSAAKKAARKKATRKKATGRKA